MSNIITWDAYNEARQLADKGDTKTAWQVLAKGGDQYARFAYYVLSGQWSFLTCMRAAHWHLVVPKEPVGGKVWNEIARNALTTYLGFIDNNHREWCQQMGVDLSAHRQMPLPNTLQIEQGYMQAVQKAGLPPDCVIHLAANGLSTRFNTHVLDRINRRTKGRYEHLLHDIRAPEWTTVTDNVFGKLDHREIHDSRQMATAGFIRTGVRLLKAAVEGGAHYAAGQLHLCRKQLLSDRVAAGPL